MNKKKRKLLDYSLNILITNYTHVGFKRNLLNHNFRKAVLGLYSNIAIINPAITLANLRIATKFLFALILQEYKIGFVFFGVPSFVRARPKKFFKSHYYVLDYWPSGLISNFFFVYESNKLFEKSCSKFPDLPGGLFVLANCHTDKALSIAQECRKLVIPAFFVLDSVTNLSAFQYWIPANLKSEHSVQFFFYHAAALVKIGELHYKKRWAGAVVKSYKKKIGFIFQKTKERRKLESRLTVMQFSKFIYSTRKRLKYLRFFCYTMRKRRARRAGDNNLLEKLKSSKIEKNISLKPRKKVPSRGVYRFFKKHYLENDNRSLFWKWYSRHYYRWRKRMFRVGYRLNRFQKSWKQEVRSKRRFRWQVLKAILGVNLYKIHRRFNIGGKWVWRRRRKPSFFNWRFNNYGNKNRFRPNKHNRNKPFFKKEKREWLPYDQYLEWKKNRDILFKLWEARQIKLGRARAKLNKILKGSSKETVPISVSMGGFQKWKKRMLNTKINKELGIFRRKSNKIPAKTSPKQLKDELKKNFFTRRFEYLEKKHHKNIKKPSLHDRRSWKKWRSRQSRRYKGFRASFKSNPSFKNKRT